MINRPPSNLQPLSSEDARNVFKHLFSAIQLMPVHRHNSRSNPQDCDICMAKAELIRAFRMFKRNGE